MLLPSKCLCAPDQNRTDTPKAETDFKSVGSTYSPTGAFLLIPPSICCYPGR